MGLYHRLWVALLDCSMLTVVAGSIDIARIRVVITTHTIISRSTCANMTTTTTTATTSTMTTTTMTTTTTIIEID